MRKKSGIIKMVKILLIFGAIFCISKAIGSIENSKIGIHSIRGGPRIIISFLASVTLTESTKIPCMARDMVDTKSIFINSCSGCHNNGGNLFNSKKTLKKNDLIAANLYDQQKLVDIIARGRGQMPAYGEFISPKGNIIPAKLSMNQIEALSNYILEMAENNWPSTAAENRNCDEYPGC